MNATVGLLSLELYVRHARSLKDKRGVVKSFKERARARHNISIAEVGDADDYKRAELAVVCVAGDEPRARGVLEAVERLVRDQFPQAEVLAAQTEMLYADGPEWNGLADYA